MTTLAAPRSHQLVFSIPTQNAGAGLTQGLLDTRRDDPSDRLLTVGWLVRLRWLEGAVLLALACLGALGWGVGRPLRVAAVALAVLLSSGGLAWWRHGGRSLQDRALGSVLLLDTVLLTVVLAVSGGDANPFALLYLVVVVTAAMSLRTPLAGLVLLATVLGYGSLFFLAPADLHHHDPAAMRAHLLGMYGAYVVAGLTMVVGFAGVRARKLQADRRLAAAREVQQQNRRLASLATLAAGAAHELATPLSTILVISHELRRRAISPRDQVDLELVEEQVARCQTVLSDLACDVGLAGAEGLELVSLPMVLAGLADESSAGGATVELDCPDLKAQLPVRIFEQVLRRLIDNAQAASPPQAQVLVRARHEGQRLSVDVIDHGQGMSAQLARRVGEPFFTTKDDGRGLGLYFVRSVIEQLGGDVHLDSRPGQGTTVHLSWPCEVTPLATATSMTPRSLTPGSLTPGSLTPGSLTPEGAT